MFLLGEKGKMPIFIEKKAFSMLDKQWEEAQP